MMVAQKTASGRPAPRWTAIGIAVAMTVLVTAGWPLVNTLLPGTAPVPPDNELPLGGDGTTHAVLVPPDDGWEMDVAASHPGRSYRLEHGSLTLDADRTGGRGADHPDMSDQWEGARRVLLSQDLTTDVDEPGPVASADGTEGWAAGVSRSSGPGTLVLLPAPSGGYTVRMVLQDADSGPGTTPQDLAHMVTFSEEGEHG